MACRIGRPALAVLWLGSEFFFPVLSFSITAGKIINDQTWLIKNQGLWAGSGSTDRRPRRACLDEGRRVGGPFRAFWRCSMVEGRCQTGPEKPNSSKPKLFKARVPSQMTSKHSTHDTQACPVGVFVTKWFESMLSPCALVQKGLSKLYFLTTPHIAKEPSTAHH